MYCCCRSGPVNDSQSLRKKMHVENIESMTIFDFLPDLGAVLNLVTALNTSVH